MSDENNKEKSQGKASSKSNEPEELVVVYRSMGPLRAHVIKGKLESAGIPAMLKYESGSTAYAVLVNGMGEVKVLVSKRHEAEAKKLIADGAN